MFWALLEKKKQSHEGKGGGCIELLVPTVCMGLSGGYENIHPLLQVSGEGDSGKEKP